MAISDKQKQKKLLKKKQKRTAAVKATKVWATNISPANCANLPLNDCIVPSNLFELGIGEVFISRQLPDGNLAVSAFIVDVFCLGVKNALFSVMSGEEYENMKEAIVGSGRELESIQANCAKKLLEGAVEYAKELGFSSHDYYKKALPLFGNIAASDCSVHYTYGKEGKPFYMRGPNESIRDAEKITATLRKKLGDEGFHYLIGLDDTAFE